MNKYVKEENKSRRPEEFQTFAERGSHRRQTGGKTKGYHGGDGSFDERKSLSIQPNNKSPKDSNKYGKLRKDTDKFRKLRKLFKGLHRRDGA